MTEQGEDWNASAQAWIAHIDRGDVNREAVLDPAILTLLGHVEGVRVLDVGCGEGRFCRILRQQGASVIGLDPTTPLLEEARRRDPDGTYVEGHAEKLPFENETFDVVISYVALIDVADYRQAIREMARVAKPGGRLVVANLNSFATSVPSGWVRDGEGNRLHFPVDNYSQERPEWVEWAGIRIINWHRPLSAYMSAYLECGLVLKSFQEPVPSPVALDKYPKAEDYFRVPYFNLMEWRKG